MSQEPAVTYTEANERIEEYFRKRQEIVKNSDLMRGEKAVKKLSIEEELRQAKEILDIIFGY